MTSLHERKLVAGSRAILAIDPSDSVHAWALITGTLEAPELLDHGRDLRSDAESYPDPHPVLLAIANRRSAPDCRVVCEMVACYGMAAGASLFDTCVEIGRLAEMFPEMERVIRPEVKLVLCGHTRAKDPNVRATVIDRFGGPAAIRKGGQLYKVAGDTWAAIAVGLAAMHPETRYYVPASQRAGGVA